jgi:hypothetical protein
MPEPNTAEFNAQEFNDSGQTPATAGNVALAASFTASWAAGIGGGVM